MTDEFKKKCSDTHKGIPHKPMADSTRHKISQRRKNKKYITNGIVVKEWDTSNPLPTGFRYGRK